MPISIWMMDMIPLSMRIQLKTISKSLECCSFSTSSKASIGGPTLNLESTMSRPLSFTIVAFSYPVLLLFLSCFGTEQLSTDWRPSMNSTLKKSLLRNLESKKNKLSKHKRLPTMLNWLSLTENDHQQWLWSDTLLH